MLIFSCTECKKKINCRDNEAVDEAFIRLDEHIEKCPPARFTFEGTTKASRRTADTIQSIKANKDLLARLQIAGEDVLPSEPRRSDPTSPPGVVTGNKRMVAFE